MDELRDRIARAIAESDSGTLHGVGPCTACQVGDTNQPCDDCLIMADAVIAALELETQEIEHPKTVFLRRYVTPWKETP